MTTSWLPGANFRLDGPFNENEMLWVEMLRLLFHDRVPVPNLPLVQTLREAARRPS